MKIVLGDLWQVEAKYCVISTNGTVSYNGNAVMGKGVALQAHNRYSGLRKLLGQLILTQGNIVHLIPRYNLVAFPTKHHFSKRADIDLIQQSVKELTNLAEQHSDCTFAMPVPGIGAGQLSIEQVWPLLRSLPDNVYVVVRSTETYQAVKKLGESMPTRSVSEHWHCRECGSCLANISGQLVCLDCSENPV